MRMFLAALLLALAAGAGADLVEELAPFEPLLGRQWTGGYLGEDPPDLEITLRFEEALDGRALRYLREAPGVDFRAETWIYPTPGGGPLRFHSLDNRGGLREGTVELSGGGIRLLGSSPAEGGERRFRSTLRLDPGGALDDIFERREGDRWVRGHLQRFVARELPPDDAEVEPRMDFLYRIQPTRPEMLTEGPTPDEERIVGEHFGFLQRLTAEGVVLLAGRTLNTDPSSFGIVIFRAESEEEARALMMRDPAVAAGVFRAELFPYGLALVGDLPVGDGE